jgi:hypothetical protein
MRRFILLPILLTLACSKSEDEPMRGAEILWVRTWGGGDEDRVTDVAVMKDGSLLAVGYAYGEVTGTFDSPGTRRDVMLVRFDADGNIMSGWPKRFGSPTEGMPYSSSRQANAVTIGPDGDIYLAGDYKGWLQLGSTLLQGPDDAEVDAFVARLSEDGEVKWVHNIPGKGWTTTTSIVADERGVVVAGFFDGRINFADASINKMDMDGWVGSYDLDGTPRELVVYGGPEHDELHAIAFDPYTGHYVAAGTAGGSRSLYGPLDPEDPRDLLVLELSDAMEVSSSPSYGGSGQEQAWAIATRGEDLVIAGELSSTLDLEGANVTAGDGLDGFAVRLDASGSATPVFAFRGNGRQVVRSAEIMADGSIVFGGWGTGVMDFGAAEGPYEALGETDAFVALVSAEGEMIELSPFGDAGIDTADAVAVAGADTYYAAGMFAWYMPMDDSLSPGGAGDAWVAKLRVK